MAQLECMCTDTMRATCELDESGNMATLVLILLGFVALWRCAPWAEDSEDDEPSAMYT